MWAYMRREVQLWKLYPLIAHAVAVEIRVGDVEDVFECMACGVEESNRSHDTSADTAGMWAVLRHI